MVPLEQDDTDDQPSSSSTILDVTYQDLTYHTEICFLLIFHRQVHTLAHALFSVIPLSSRSYPFLPIITFISSNIMLFRVMPLFLFVIEEVP